MVHPLAERVSVDLRHGSFLNLSPPKYLQLVVYRKAQGGAPLIKKIVKLSDIDDVKPYAT